MVRHLTFSLALLGLSVSATATAPLTPDVSFTPTEAEAALFTVADNNHDNVSWGFYNETKTNHQTVFNSNVYKTDNASSELPYNDWLFLPAIQFTDADALYEFKCDAARGSFSQYWGVDEVFEVKIGTAPNAQSMTTQIMGDTHLTLQNNRDGKLKTFTEMFSVPSPGVYYIGIRCCSSDSKSLGMYLANISVTRQQSSTSAPEGVTGLTATPGRNGVLTTSLVFYMPDRDVKGNQLPADAVIRAVATSSVDTKETTGAPGATCMIADLGTVQGLNDITVTTYIGENGGKPATTQIYTGVSIPGPVTNTRCKSTADNMTLRFEWDAPVRTADGNGFVSPTGNTYIIYEELMNNIMGMDTYYWNQVGELPADQTWYEYPMPDDGIQRRVKIGVVAQNAAGVNNSVVTPIVGLGGKPYELPVIEDFTGCSLTEFNYNPIMNWEPDTDYSGQTWTVNDPAIIGPQYNIDHKPVLIFSNHIGTRTRVSVPKFSTAGASAPSAKFAVYMGADTPDLSVYAMTMESDGWFKVGDIAVDRTAGTYRVVDVPLGAECADQPWVLMAVDGYFDPAQYQIGFISEYSIVNSLDTDLGVLSVSGASPVVGNSETYTAVVYNPGRQAATMTRATWQVVSDGNVIVSEEAALPTAAIEPEHVYDFEWTFTPRAEMIGAAEVRFAIEVANDGDRANNTASVPVMIKSGAKVTVRDLRATEQSDGSVVLAWTEPAANMAVESFENDIPYERTGTIAGFTNIDGDGYQVWNLGEKDPMGPAARAWSVWDKAWTQQAFGNAYIPSHGNQYLLVTCPGDELAIPPRADDWLISPEVNGLSFVAFDARVISVLYGTETLEFLYSSTTPEPESFTLLETIPIAPTLQTGDDGLETLVYARYSSELPADARYFALRYRSHDCFGMMLDRLEYAPASADRGITGYDIYRDGALIAENAQGAGTYTDTGIIPGSAHSYTVYPRTEGDNGAMSNVASINGGSAIGLPAADSTVTVIASAGMIHITAAAPTSVTVCTPSGMTVASLTVDGTASLPVTPGIYLVATPAATHKLAVR